MPSNEAADPVEEVGLYLPLAGPAHDVEADTHFLDYNPRLHDPALDEFFFEARFGGSHGHGPYGLEPRRVELTDDGSDVFFISPASDPDGDSTEVFISLPEGETASVVPLGDATEDFGFGSFSREDVTFGGGENPCWMLTLLSSSDGHNNDAWFGHPEPGIDPWG